MNPIRTLVDIKCLHPFLQNPRIPPVMNDFDAIKSLYSHTNDSSRQLLNLARSILKSGFDSTEPIYAVHNSKKDDYTVYEGNRRLAALKIINNPEEYASFLRITHLNFLKLSNKNDIPQKIEITVVSRDEALKKIERIHQGALDGIGRLKWDAESSRRFAKSMGYDKTYAGKISEPFELKFGEPIGGYLGGITAADKLLNNKSVKKLVLGQNKENSLETQLDIVKDVFDEALQVSNEKGTSITRTFGKNQDIDEELIPRITGNTLIPRFNEPSIKPMNFGLLKFVDSESIIKKDEYYWINQTFAAFQRYWPKNIPNRSKHLVSFLIAPSIRSIFEGCTQLLQSDPLARKELSLKPNKSLKSDSIYSIIGQWKNNDAFLSYFTAQIPGVLTSVNTITDLLIPSDFKSAWAKSNPGAHSGARYLYVNEIEEMTNKAELMALLTEHFIEYMNEIH